MSGIEMTPRSSAIAASRKQQLVAKLEDSRKEQITYLHSSHKSAHWIDTIYSFIAGNMTFICWILGGLYWQRPCEKPLQYFLIILGCLAPFAACLPILMRQWFYLHLRANIVAIGIFGMSATYFVWLLIGQHWAFETSPATCDAELSTATNAAVFILFLNSLMYICKVIWYLLLRVRYTYRDLFMSCFKDPYPNPYALSDEDFCKLEHQIAADEGSIPDLHTDSVDEVEELGHDNKPVWNRRSTKTSPGIEGELMYHQEAVLQGLNRLSDVFSAYETRPKGSIKKNYTTSRKKKKKGQHAV